MSQALPLSRFFARQERLWVRLACAITGVMFLVASFHKVRDPLAFAENIYHYQVLPDSLVNLVAIFLPWLEIVAGIALLAIPRLRLSSAWLLLGLLIFFTGLVGVTLARGIDVACGCFSSSPDADRIGWTKLAENAGWILVAAFAVWGLRKEGASRIPAQNGLA